VAERIISMANLSGGGSASRAVSSIAYTCAAIW
jgi:hypothetical protein